MTLVTLIIPMYNEENNVKSCINMLREQTNQNFEVVFVNDGSTDDTMHKLNNYINKNEKFVYRVLSQENKGAAAARKNGILNARTEYIMICDCDDLLSNNLVEEIYNSQQDYKDADIFIPNLKYQSKDRKWNDFSFFNNDQFLDPLESLINSLDGWGIHGCFAIKRNIFLKSYNDYKNYNNLDVNYINNDEILTRLNIFNSNKIIRINADYLYQYNKNSTTKKINQNRYLMIENAIILDKIFNDNKAISHKAKDELLAVIWFTYVYMKQNSMKIEKLEEWEKAIKKSVKFLKYSNYLYRLKYKKIVKLTILKLRFIF